MFSLFYQTVTVRFVDFLTKPRQVAFPNLLIKLGLILIFFNPYRKHFWMLKVKKTYLLTLAWITLNRGREMHRKTC